MMADQEEADCAQGIIGADEVNLFGLGEVAEVEEAELAEAKKEAYGARILALVECPLRFFGTSGVWFRPDSRY